MKSERERVKVFRLCKILEERKMLKADINSTSIWLIVEWRNK